MVGFPREGGTFYNALMLRIVVISLVVANLLLLGFEASKPAAEKQAASQRAEAQDSSIPTIHMLSELVNDQDLMSVNRQCFSLGPFHSNENMLEVREHLLDISVDVRARTTQAMVEHGYWLYMPPYESLLEANRALLSLQALGLEDVGVIYDGKWANAVSLGYFFRQENAQNRIRGLNERGYSPQMKVRRHAEPRYWLDYEQDTGSELLTLDLQGRPIEFTQRPLPCL